VADGGPSFGCATLQGNWVEERHDQLYSSGERYRGTSGFGVEDKGAGFGDLETVRRMNRTASSVCSRLPLVERRRRELFSVASRLWAEISEVFLIAIRKNSVCLLA
jgi:hypothetical protein